MIIDLGTEGVLAREYAMQALVCSFVGLALTCSGSGSPIWITTDNPLPDGIVGVGYSVTFEARGREGAFSWTGEGLPFGSLDGSTGVFSGVPDSSGAQEMTVRVQLGGGRDSQVFAFDVYDALGTTLSNPPYMQGGDGVLVTSVVTGGKEPYSCSFDGEDLAAGSIPEGVSLDGQSCSLSGTVTEQVAGTYGFFVTVTDALGQTINIPVFYSNGSCTTASTTLAPAETPPRVEPGGSSYGWDVSITDMDVPCLPPDCADCQACYGISFPTAAPVEAVEGLNCTGASGVCYECVGCIHMDGACPGAGSITPTLRVEEHDRVSGGGAWIQFSFRIDYTGEDGQRCSGKRWQCHVAIFEQ